MQRAAEACGCLDRLQLIAQASGSWSIVHFAYVYFLISFFISCLVHVWECNIHKIICFGVEKNNNNGEWNCTAMNFDWDVLPCAPAGGIMLMEWHFHEDFLHSRSFGSEGKNSSSAKKRQEKAAVRKLDAIFFILQNPSVPMRPSTLYFILLLKGTLCNF